MEEEIRYLKINQNWEEMIKPADANLVSTKWGFSTKLKPDGSLDRFRARLVAKIYTRQYRTDFQDKYAPTVQMPILRAFLAINAVENLEIEHFNIKKAFIEASLNQLSFSDPHKVST